MRKSSPHEMKIKRKTRHTGAKKVIRPSTSVDGKPREEPDVLFVIVLSPVLNERLKSVLPSLEDAGNLFGSESIPNLCNGLLNLEMSLEVRALEIFPHYSKELRIAWADIWRILQVRHLSELFVVAIASLRTHAVERSVHFSRDTSPWPDRSILFAMT
jgi:hypothetical protein